MDADNNGDIYAQTLSSGYGPLRIELYPGGAVVLYASSSGASWDIIGALWRPLFQRAPGTIAPLWFITAPRLFTKTGQPPGAIPPGENLSWI